MAKYLLLINLGPVQSFIATARRTRDLYAGSRLLSEAAHKVVKHLQEGIGARLIFPAVKKAEAGEKNESDQGSGIPNVILAEVEASSHEEVQKLASRAKEKAQEYIVSLADNTFKKEPIRGLFKPDKDIDDALKQVEDLLEFYWVAVPLNGKGYASARELAIKTMAARKNTRDFAPNPCPANVPKSSLDGALEGVIYPASEREEALMARAGIRPGEVLSGVDLLKRSSYSTGFASTTDMALMPFLAGLSEADEAKLKEELGKIAKILHAGPSNAPEHLKKDAAGNPNLLSWFEARLFFPSRHQELARESVGELDEETLKHTQESLAAVYAKIQKGPYPYYAILHADGDRMGKAIDAQKDAESHRELSRKLTEFSDRVREIVEKRSSGSLVYAGGDDVLALLPLHTALQCANELQKEFAERLACFASEDSPGPTLSVGLAVVHHLFDLGEALNLARKAEKEAKKTRNALAVIFSPRSGSETVAGGKWCESPPPNERLEKMACWIAKGAIPQGFAYELLEAHRVLQALEDDSVLAKEAERILKRKGANEDEVKPVLMEWIKEKAIGVEKVASELLVARSFARAFELAGNCEHKTKGGEGR